MSVKKAAKRYFEINLPFNIFGIYNCDYEHSYRDSCHTFASSESCRKLRTVEENQVERCKFVSMSIIKPLVFMLISALS